MELTHAQVSQISPSFRDEILPTFRLGQRVRINKAIRNDGSNPFRGPSEVLVDVGAEGYVKHIGDFLQVIRIYEVHFIEEGETYGCRESELESAAEFDGYDEVAEELKWIREHRAQRAAMKEQQSQEGEA